MYHRSTALAKANRLSQLWKVKGRDAASEILLERGWLEQPECSKTVDRSLQGAVAIAIARALRSQGKTDDADALVSMIADGTQSKPMDSMTHVTIAEAADYWANARRFDDAARVRRILRDSRPGSMSATDRTRWFVSDTYHLAFDLIWGGHHADAVEELESALERADRPKAQGGLDDLSEARWWVTNLRASILKQQADATKSPDAITRAERAESSVNVLRQARADANAKRGKDGAEASDNSEPLATDWTPKIEPSDTRD